MNKEKYTSGNVLISLSDKTNLDLLVIDLIPKGYSIYSTGGTYKQILEICQKESLSTDKVISIDSYIDFPEILGGRVKTLHPKIYGGILGNLSKKSDQDNLLEHNILCFDYIFINLYPFKDTLLKYGFDFDNNQKPDYLSKEDELAIIESIDIGGVSLLRASAKNYQYCLPIIDYKNYYNFLLDVPSVGEISRISFDKRIKLAQEAYQHIAEYDDLINQFYLLLAKYRNNVITLKYGLNPHQHKAQLSWTQLCSDNSCYPFEILNGNVGYINLMDAIHSYLLVLEAKEVFNCPCVASFKHTSPAGVGLGDRLLDSDELKHHNLPSDYVNQSLVASAYVRGRGGDPLSSFGDFIAVGGIVDLELANLIKKEVSDGIIACNYTDEALEILKSKKQGKYVILIGNPKYLQWYLENSQIETRELFGMILSQSPNKVISDFDFLEKSKIVTKNQNLPEQAKRDLLLANMTLKYAQSNNICYVYQGQVIGLSAGQQNRVDSVILAGKKAQRWFLSQSPMVKRILTYLKSDLNLKRQDRINLIMEIVKNYEDHHLDNPIRNDNSYFERYVSHFEGYVNRKDLLLNDEETRLYLNQMMYNVSMASDAFFPFDDNIYRAYQYGVKYILHPGGSLADQQCIETANKYDMVMVESGQRMFYH